MSCRNTYVTAMTILLKLVALKTGVLNPYKAIKSRNATSSIFSLKDLITMSSQAQKLVVDTTSLLKPSPLNFKNGLQFW